MPWPLVPTRAKRDRKPSGVNHCRREIRKQLSSGQSAAELQSACTSNPTGSFRGSKKWAESQKKALALGADVTQKDWHPKEGPTSPGSTHPAELFVIKGFSEEQTQQLQLALAEHSNTIRVDRHWWESVPD